MSSENSAYRDTNAIKWDMICCLYDASLENRRLGIKELSEKINLNGTRTKDVIEKMYSRGAVDKLPEGKRDTYTISAKTREMIYQLMGQAKVWEDLDAAGFLSPYVKKLQKISKKLPVVAEEKVKKKGI